MGTNYYAKRILSVEDIEKCKNLMENHNYEELKKILHNKTDLVHIGKSSGGWKFLFNWNNCKYYDLTKDSIINFLSSNVIVNEYGEEIALEAFLELVKSKEQGIDNTEYYEKDGKIYDFLIDCYYPSELNKYHPKNHEFYADGWRFSTSVDFS